MLQIYTLYHLELLLSVCTFCCTCSALRGTWYLGQDHMTCKSSTRFSVLHCLSVTLFCVNLQDRAMRNVIYYLLFYIDIFTGDGLIFMGYKFSWFSWRERSTNSNTYELAIFCMNYEGNTVATNYESYECVKFVQPTEIGTHENKTIHNICGLWGSTGGHLIIGRTQLSDVASFRALQTRICEVWIQCRQLHEKLKPHRKNYQITTNNKHFTVANVHPSFPRPYARTGEVNNFKTWNFFSKTCNHSSSVTITCYFDLK